METGTNRPDLSPCLEEIKPGSRRLYLIFGGIAAMIQIPPFEFYRSSRILDDSKIFFRDFSQSWYQCGLPGIADNVFDLAAYLKGRIDTLGPEKVYFVGNSMGGFAAIMFASLIGRGQAIAFSPQTCLSWKRRRAMRDTRWKWKIYRMYCKTIFNKHVYDLPDLLPSDNDNLSIDIHVSSKSRLDMQHASALEHFRQVTVHRHDLGAHDLVKYLRDNDALCGIMSG